MLQSLIFENNSYRIEATKKILTKVFGNSLKDLISNIDNIINDPILNRLMRELGYDTQKGMVSSSTTGYGASAGYYIVKGTTIIDIINRQIKDKKIDSQLELKKANPNTTIVNANENLISMLESYIKYFSAKLDKYFIINGQHRFDSIKADYKGELETKKSKKEFNTEYSNLIIKDANNKIIANEKVLSLNDLEKKIKSADSDICYDWVETFSRDEKNEIYDNYLNSCQIYIFEITNAADFKSLTEFIWQSNSSTEWDEFLFYFLQSFSPYNKWFREQCMPKLTNEYSVWQELVYGVESPISFGKGTFKSAGGGWQYFISTIINTCYVSPNLMDRFEVKSKVDIIKSLLNDDSLFLPEWGEASLTDLAQVMAAIKKIANSPNSKIFKDIYTKPSFVIYVIFALNFYKKRFKYTYGKEKWQLNIKEENTFEFVRDLMMIFFERSSWASDENTNFWNTQDGIEQIEKWKTKNAFDTTKLIHPLRAKDLYPEFQDEWVKNDIETKCEKNETKDIEKSFRRHFIGDLLTWGNDHSCVVNVINEYIEDAFQETAINLKKDPKIPFGSIGFVACSTLPKASQLVSSNYTELYDLFDSKEETDRAHGVARAKGGKNTTSNIELGSKKLNRKQKAVV